MAGHWTDAVERVLMAQGGDLRALAEIAGFDPTDFYVGQDLGGCDLRGQDLRGINFDGCNLERAILDNATKLDPKFDPRIEDGEDYWRFNISSELNTMVLHFMKDASYIYSAWAYRNLVESAFLSIVRKEFEFFEGIVKSNSNLTRAIEDRRKVNQVGVRVLLYEDKIRDVEHALGRSLTEDDGRWMIMIGLLRHRIRYGDSKDYSNLSLNAFYPPDLIKVERGLSGRVSYD